MAAPADDHDHQLRVTRAYGEDDDGRPVEWVTSTCVVCGWSEARARPAPAGPERAGARPPVQHGGQTPQARRDRLAARERIWGVELHKRLYRPL